MPIGAISSGPTSFAGLSSIRVASVQLRAAVPSAAPAIPSVASTPVPSAPIVASQVSQAAIAVMASNLAAQMAGIIEARLEYAASSRLVQTASQMQLAALNVLA